MQYSYPRLSLPGFGARTGVAGKGHIPPTRIRLGKHNHGHAAMEPTEAARKADPVSSG